MMVAGIINLVLVGLEWWLKRQLNNAEALKQFYAFVHSMDGKTLPTVKLGQSYREQVKRLQELAKKEGAG